MLTLSDKTVEYIERVTAVAAIANIDAVVFSKDVVSGKDDTPAVVIIQNTNLPEFEFDEMAIHRIPFFRQRLDVVKSAKNSKLVVEFNQQTGQVVMKSGRTRAEYRVGNPVAIRPPKALNDTPEYAFTIDDEFVPLLARAAAAYPAKEPTITFTSNGSSEVEMSVVDDTTGDSFSAHVSSDLVSDKNLSVRYRLKTLLPLLRHHDNNSIIIGARGTMTLSIDGINLGVIPKV